MYALLFPVALLAGIGLVVAGMLRGIAIPWDYTTQIILALSAYMAASLVWSTNIRQSAIDLQFWLSMFLIFMLARMLPPVQVILLAYIPGIFQERLYRDYFFETEEKFIEVNRFFKIIYCQQYII